jgi:hypothetical protein
MASVAPSLVSGTVVAVTFNPIDRALYLCRSPSPESPGVSSLSKFLTLPHPPIMRSSVKEKRPLFVLDNFKCTQNFQLIDRFNFSHAADPHFKASQA